MQFSLSRKMAPTRVFPLTPVSEKRNLLKHLFIDLNICFLIKKACRCDSGPPVRKYGIVLA